MYSWTIKKAEHWKIDAFELWCWRRFLRVPWIARKSSQLILSEINPEYSLEGLMPKLKLQYFGHLMWTANSLEKIWVLRKTEGKRRRRWQRMGLLDSISLTQWTWTWANSGRQWRTEKPWICSLWSESHSVVSDSATPWTIQSMDFSRPEYWSGYPFLSPGDHPNPRIEPRSPAL